MDDRFVYLLNGLLARHFSLGRIARFRQVTRGRQAQTFEVLTAEAHEFTIWLLPPHFAPPRDGASHFDRIAPLLEGLERQRFPVMPFMRTSDRPPAVTAEGPQGQILLVSESPRGQALPATEYTPQNLAMLGLRLAWLHNLSAQILPTSRTPTRPSLSDQLDRALATPNPKVPAFPAAMIRPLAHAAATLPTPNAFAHGDLSPAAVLLDHDRHVRAFVDLALLHPGDPLEDLLDVLLHWCTAPDATIRIEHLRALLEAYRSQRPMTQKQDHEQVWNNAVHAWLVQRILTAANETRPLPTGFTRMLANPRGLADAMALCEPK